MELAKQLVFIKEDVNCFTQSECRDKLKTILNQNKNRPRQSRAGKSTKKRLTEFVLIAVLIPIVLLQSVVVLFS